MTSLRPLASDGPEKRKDNETCFLLLFKTCCELGDLTSDVSKENPGLLADSSESGEGEEPRIARWRGERAECNGLSWNDRHTRFHHTPETE